MLSLNEVLSDFRDYADLHEDEVVTVDSRGQDGKTPLHWMAILGDHQGIAILVKAGAVINTVDAMGSAAVHDAVINRQTTAVKKLIAFNADLSIKNSFGQTPMDISRSDGFQPIIDIFEKLGL